MMGSQNSPTTVLLYLNVEDDPSLSPPSHPLRCICGWGTGGVGSQISFSFWVSSRSRKTQNESENFLFVIKGIKGVLLLSPPLRRWSFFPSFSFFSLVGEILFFLSLSENVNPQQFFLFSSVSGLSRKTPTPTRSLPAVVPIRSRSCVQSLTSLELNDGGR